MSNLSPRFIPAPPRAIALVTLAYVIAGALAWATLRATPTLHPLLALFLADTVATVVVFAFSRAFDNSSFYDPYWSVAPMVFALGLPFSGLPGVAALGPRQVLMAAVTSAWGLRLTYNWLRGWEGLTHEDWRYVAFRKQFPRGYWPFSFLAIHFFPTVCTFASSLPMWPVATSSAPLGWLDALGVAVALGATVIEGVADAQLRAYRKDCEAKGVRGAICEVGLWSWSRHPNYFGECTFWLGVWILGVGASTADAAWTSVGPLGIFALFVFGTIPLAEKRSLERRPAFAEHQRRVSMLIPWPPKK
jgi:steroid 5-alpha reductase family enzyme